MTSMNSDYQALLSDFTSGDTAATDLPLEDQGFWRFLFESAAHPGRSGRTSKVAAAAERLLHRLLARQPAGVRQGAALEALASDDRSTRRQAIRFLHDIDADKDVLAAVSNMIHDADAEVRFETVRLLTQYPSKQTLPALLSTLETTFDLRETLAAEALEEIGSAALPGLTAMLENEDGRTRTLVEGHN